MEAPIQKLREKERQAVRAWKITAITAMCVAALAILYLFLRPVGSISATDFLTANAFEGFRVTAADYDYFDSPFTNLSGTGEKVHWLKFERDMGDRGRFSMKVASRTYEGEWNISDRTFVNMTTETLDGKRMTTNEGGGLFLRLPRHPDDPVVIASLWEEDADSPFQGVLVVRSRGEDSWWRQSDGSTHRPSRLVVRPGGS